MDTSAASQGSTPTPHPARFEAVYGASYQAMWSYCARRLPISRVDDAVADIFTVAWRRIEDVPVGEESLPWLYGVAFRIVSQHRRSLTRKNSLAGRLGRFGNPSEAGVELQVVERQEYRQIRLAAERLKPHDREVLQMCLWDELPYAQVATVLAISEDTVRQRLHRAKARLAHEYERLSKRTYRSPDAQKGGER